MVICSCCNINTTGLCFSAFLDNAVDALQSFDIIVRQGLSVEPLQQVKLFVVRKLREEEIRRTIAGAIVDAIESVVVTMREIVSISNENIQSRRSSKRH